MANALLAFRDVLTGGATDHRPAIVTPAGATTYRELLALAARATCCAASAWSRSR